jgi:hypothetical protein
VAEHEELDLPLNLLATSGSEETADQEVQEREQHGAPSPAGDRMLPAPPTPNREIEPFSLLIPLLDGDGPSIEAPNGAAVANSS